MAKLKLVAFSIAVLIACSLAPVATQENPEASIPESPGQVLEPHPPDAESMHTEPEAAPETAPPEDAGSQESPAGTECELTAWSGWTECSQACEGGVMTRTREVIRKGSQECPGLTDTRDCNTQSCLLTPVRMQAIHAWPQGRKSIINAIDKDPETWTYTTKGWCTEDSIFVGVTFLQPSMVSGLRILKKYQASKHNRKDCNRKNIQIMYSTGSPDTPLERHSWKPVSNAQNGYAGKELWNAAGVHPSGRIRGDEHNSAEDGWGSVSFESTEMTALALEITAHEAEYNHFCLAEVMAFRAPHATQAQEL